MVLAFIKCSAWTMVASGVVRKADPGWDRAGQTRPINRCLFARSKVASTAWPERRHHIDRNARDIDDRICQHLRSHPLAIVPRKIANVGRIGFVGQRRQSIDMRTHDRLEQLLLIVSQTPKSSASASNNSGLLAGWSRAYHPLGQPTLAKTTRPKSD